MTTVKISGGGTSVRVAGGSARRVVLNNATVAQIDNNRPDTSVVTRTTGVALRPTVNRVNIGGAMGAQGIPGTTDGATFTADAGEVIHGGRAVRLQGGLVYHPDTTNNTHAETVCGIAVNSAALGQPVVVRTKGPMTETYWTWAPGFVFVADGGVLTQTPDPGRWLLEIARVKSPTTLDVDVEVPLFRGYGDFGAPVFTAGGSELPGAEVGVPYTYTFTADGGDPPVTFTIVAGTLPPGLTLSPEGELSGTPT